MLFVHIVCSKLRLIGQKGKEYQRHLAGIRYSLLFEAAEIYADILHV